MKKLLLITMVVCGIQITGQNVMYVDSVRILPAAPTANDSVWLHIYWWSGYGTTPMTPSVMHAGNNHTVSACYIVGVIAVVTGGDDSIFLFQGPQGLHMVSWTIMQNGTQTTNCDMLVNNGQQQVNVIATDIEEETSPAPMEWASGMEYLRCNYAGTLDIYSVNGQMVSSSAVRAGELVAVRGETGQMYFATFREANGEVSTLKFVLE